MPKLTYFNVIGRGETIRLIFKVAGVEFEDCRVEMTGFTPEWKAETPFGQLPVLEIDGLKLCQSNAIARYLAKKYNLNGKTDKDQAQIDMIIDCMDDAVKPMVAYYFEKDETRKAEGRKKYVEEQMPAYLKSLEKLLRANQDGDQYFVGDQLTWLDLQFLSFNKWISHSGVENPLSEFPKLAALKKRIEEIPKIAEWIKERPQTQF